MPCSEVNLMCFLISAVNLATSIEAGTRNLWEVKKLVIPENENKNETYFFLSMSAMLLFGAFCTMTGILSGYLERIFSATSFLFSVLFSNVRSKARKWVREKYQKKKLKAQVWSEEMEDKQSNKSEVQIRQRKKPSSRSDWKIYLQQKNRTSHQKKE